jgi:hypothetical protein
MSDELGKEARKAFVEMVRLAGTDCDVRGERKRGIKQTRKKPGYIVFQFPDEFAIRLGDRIREIATETSFDVVDLESQSAGGVYNRFEVTTRKVS